MGGFVHQLGEDLGDGRLLADHADRLAAMTEPVPP
jgi:hypothetical protein